MCGDSAQGVHTKTNRSFNIIIRDILDAFSLPNTEYPWRKKRLMWMYVKKIAVGKLVRNILSEGRPYGMGGVQ